MIYFTSDTHYWHQNVIRYCSRPHKTVEEMNEDLILRWNSIVKPEDTVYVLGDFSLAFRAVELYTKRLMGTKILVPGNHDFCHSYHKKSRNIENRDKWAKKYVENGWIVFPEQNVLPDEAFGIFKLCHFPYLSPSDTIHEDKYNDWRPTDNGDILLCGHIHEKWLTKRSSKGTLMINVGVDVWNYTPVSLDQIKELISKEIK